MTGWTLTNRLNNGLRLSWRRKKAIMDRKEVGRITRTLRTATRGIRGFMETIYSADGKLVQECLPGERKAAAAMYRRSISNGEGRMTLGQLKTAGNNVLQALPSLSDEAVGLKAKGTHKSAKTRTTEDFLTYGNGADCESFVESARKAVESFNEIYRSFKDVEETGNVKPEILETAKA